MLVRLSSAEYFEFSGQQARERAILGGHGDISSKRSLASVDPQAVQRPEPRAVVRTPVGLLELICGNGTFRGLFSTWRFPACNRRHGRGNTHNQLGVATVTRMSMCCCGRPARLFYRP